MSDETKFILEVEERQLRVILSALDMYSRMGMGQLDVAVEEFLNRRFKYDEAIVPFPVPYPGEPRLAVKWLINTLKAVVFGHPPNGSWGISAEEVPLGCREAFDLRQVFRKALAEENHRRALAEGDENRARAIRTRVDMGSYMASNPGWPKAKATVK